MLRPFFNNPRYGALLEPIEGKKAEQGNRAEQGKKAERKGKGSVKNAKKRRKKSIDLDEVDSACSMSYSDDVVEESDSFNIEPMMSKKRHMNCKAVDDDGNDDIGEGVSFMFYVFTQSYDYDTRNGMREIVELTCSFVYDHERKLLIKIICKRRVFKNNVNIWSFISKDVTLEKFYKYVDDFRDHLEIAKSSHQAPMPKKDISFSFIPIPPKSNYRFEDLTERTLYADSYAFRFWRHIVEVVTFLNKGVRKYPWNAALIALNYGDALSVKREKRMLRESLEDVSLPAKMKTVHMTREDFLKRFELNLNGHTIRYLYELSNQSLQNLHDHLTSLNERREKMKCSN
jgi:hypothetical protein